MKTLVVILLLAFAVGCSSGFTNRDIASVQESIKSDFEKRNYTVTEVKLTRQSDLTLKGYVRYRRNVPDVGEMDFSRVCTATMDKDSGKYTWGCQ